MYHAASVPHLGQPSTEQNEVGERENEVMDTGMLGFSKFANFRPIF